MPHPLLNFSQSDHLIQIVDINSYTEWQTVQIQISWLLQKPADLDLHCLQRQGISGFSGTRVRIEIDIKWQPTHSIGYPQFSFILFFKISTQNSFCIYTVITTAVYIIVFMLFFFFFIQTLFNIYILKFYRPEKISFFYFYLQGLTYCTVSIKEDRPEQTV